jgi:hypothetical protein
LHNEGVFAMHLRLYRHLSVALIVGVLLAGTAVPVSAQEGTYPTRNGPRTASQLYDELHAINYPGPWDVNSMIAAYQRAAAPAVQLCETHFAGWSAYVEVYGPGANAVCAADVSGYAAEWWTPINRAAPGHTRSCRVLFDSGVEVMVMTPYGRYGVED